MKQLIFIGILIAGGYYLYNSSFFDVLKNTRLDPTGFVEDVKAATSSTVAAVTKRDRFPKLPQRAESRSGGVRGARTSIKLIEDTILNTYDVNASYALLDVMYSSGADNSKALIKTYLLNFSMPEDRDKLLELITAYKDQETLDILVEMINKGTFARRTLFKKINAFENPVIIPILDSFVNSNNSGIQKEAKQAKNEMLQSAWYLEYQNEKEQAQAHSGSGKMTLHGASVKNILEGTGGY